MLATHPRDLILATRPADVVSGRDRIGVRVWSERSVAVVVARIDDHGPIRLEPDGPGRWSAPLDGGRLAKGEHALVVEAVDIDERRGRHALAFLVDPTGRFTAVPRAEPRVTATAFC